MSLYLPQFNVFDILLCPICGVYVGLSTSLKRFSFLLPAFSAWTLLNKAPCWMAMHVLFPEPIRPITRDPDSPCRSASSFPTKNFLKELACRVVCSIAQLGSRLCIVLEHIKSRRCIRNATCRGTFIATFLRLPAISCLSAVGISCFQFLRPSVILVR